MTRIFLRLWRNKKGATAIEYGLILALIALALVAGITNLGKKTGSMWNNVSGTYLAHG